MNVTVQDKAHLNRLKQRRDFEKVVYQVDQVVAKLPRTGGEVAGYLHAHGRPVHGDRTTEGNPVARFIRFGSGLGAREAKVTVDRDHITVDADEFEAKISTPQGVKTFLQDFAYGFYGHLHKGDGSVDDNDD